MPSLEVECVQTIINNDDKIYDIFVETGTFFGDTIFSMKKYFKELHTIEIQKEYYLKAKHTYNDNKIHFYCGDSALILKDVVQIIKSNAIFFLDGHWSGGGTGLGIKECPLYEEIESINDYFKHNAIIIIDDYRLFGVGPNTDSIEQCNWENINKNNILKIVDKRLIKSYHMPSELHPLDRFVIHLDKISE